MEERKLESIKRFNKHDYIVTFTQTETFGWLRRLFGAKPRTYRTQVVGSGGCWSYYPSGISCGHGDAWWCIARVKAWQWENEK